MATAKAKTPKVKTPETDEDVAKKLAEKAEDGCPFC
jgi:organic hydroperoxide reductase OsmC/OhrA